MKPNLKINFKKLNKREQYAILAASGIIGIYIIIQLVVMPLFNKVDQLQRNLQAKGVILEEMRRLQAEYDALKSKEKSSKARFGRRMKGFTLFSFLDKLAGESGVKESISYMKPSKTVQKDSPYKISRVEMKLESINLEQLTKYLHGIETSKNMVTVKKISISKKGKKEGLLTAVLQVETVEI